ncbi:MAG TPA: hypothetical protein ACFYEM_11350 [Candidatus Hypogeohydataceae bacterium YC40]
MLTFGGVLQAAFLVLACSTPQNYCCKQFVLVVDLYEKKIHRLDCPDIPPNKPLSSLLFLDKKSSPPPLMKWCPACSQKGYKKAHRNYCCKRLGFRWVVNKKTGEVHRIDCTAIDNLKIANAILLSPPVDFGGVERRFEVKLKRHRCCEGFSQRLLPIP